jgi:predicted amidophosphoribosyltransferase
MMPDRPNSRSLFAPSCPLCGTRVDQRNQLCPECAKLPASRKPPATFETGAQPEPPYHREGNFRRITEGDA